MSQIDTYLLNLRQGGRHSDNTLRAIERDLRQLAQLLATASSVRSRSTRRRLNSPAEPVAEPDWAQVDPDALRTRLSRLRAGGLSPASLARLASSWRGFFDWLASGGVILNSPMIGLRTPKRARRLPKALSPDEALLLVTAPQSPTEALSADDEILVLALAELLYGTGLRIAECVGLDVSAAAFDLRCRSGAVLGGWVDGQNANLHVMGKGGRSRIVPLGKEALERLSQWLAVRAKRISALKTSPGPADAPVFIGSRGLRLGVRAAQRLLEKWAIVSGVGRHVHPHMLRHSFASHVLQSSGDLRAVQELMGHASIASTQVYTALDFQHLSAVYDQAHPRAKKRPQS